MNYDLAKQLKEVGFPQELKGGKLMAGIDNMTPTELISPNGIYKLSEDDLVYLPTLEELIESCGDNFSSLSKTSLGFMCGGRSLSITDNILFDNNFYISPTEAVANLWLALNKK